MKKQYSNPKIEIVTFIESTPLAVSGVGGNNGIGFGGFANDSFEADAPIRRYFFGNPF